MVTLIVPQCGKKVYSFSQKNKFFVRFCCQKKLFPVEHFSPEETEPEKTAAINKEVGVAMKLKEHLKTVEKRSVLLFRWFLRLAIGASLIGIWVAQEETNIRDARYWLLLSVILVCQGLWGAVLLDCFFRKFQKK